MLKLRFKPQMVACDESKLEELKKGVAALEIEGYEPELLAGPQGQIEVARHPDCKTVVTGIVGCAGLIPTIEAIKAKKDIALANKAWNAFGMQSKSCDNHFNII